MKYWCKKLKESPSYRIVSCFYLALVLYSISDGIFSIMDNQFHIHTILAIFQGTLMLNVIPHSKYWYQKEKLTVNIALLLQPILTLFRIHASFINGWLGARTVIVDLFIGISIFLFLLLRRRYLIKILSQATNLEKLN